MGAQDNGGASADAETTTTPSLKKSASMTSPASLPSSAPASGIDAHPYARGSVIEVLHGKRVEESETKYWWSDSDDDDEATNGNEEQPKEEEKGKDDDPSGAVTNETDDTAAATTNACTVRLCDIIDRVTTDSKTWRYYVHYRDFNRRLDEWISMDRIVSPPSIGNAKARALKKQKDKLKRKLAKLEEQQNLQQQEWKNKQRTSSIVGDAPSTSPDGVVVPRMTRRRQQQRQKSDDGADTHEGGDISADGGAAVVSLASEPPQVVKLAAASTSETTVIDGQHVVATIPAQELDEHEGLDEASLREHEEVTKVKNVAFMELGEFRMETWYYSPLPKELLSEQGYVEILYVCEFSFNMFPRKSELLRYQTRELPKNRRHPPGNEIYRNGNLSMFEVDGFEERIYCQNLCYIAKLFLDHKTLYFDVDPFLFYVLCEVDDRGFHPVGYYSKEKYSDVGYNLACILTFPSHQRKGYGRFLIAFSYALSQKEERVGSPEKPISDLGQKAYKPYWMSTIVDFLIQNSDYTSMSIMDISKMTSIMAEDIVFTLNQLGILKIISGVYFIAADHELLLSLQKKHPVKDPQVDMSKLHWTPFITEVKRDKFSIHSKKPTFDGSPATTMTTSVAAAAANQQASTAVPSLDRGTIS